MRIEQHTLIARKSWHTSNANFFFLERLCSLTNLTSVIPVPTQRVPGDWSHLAQGHSFDEDILVMGEPFNLRFSSYCHN